MPLGNAGVDAGRPAAEQSRRRASRGGGRHCPRLHGDARLGHAQLRCLQPARGHPLALGRVPRRPAARPRAPARPPPPATAPLHVGTDIGGSIRLPGTWLGLTTLKPSAGRVPLDTPYLGRVAGPMTRSAADAALLLSVISRPDVRDWTSLPPAVLPRRIAVLTASPGCGSVCISMPAVVWPSTARSPSRRGRRRSLRRRRRHGGGRCRPFIDAGLLDDLDPFWRIRSLDRLSMPSTPARERVLPFIRGGRSAAAGRRRRRPARLREHHGDPAGHRGRDRRLRHRALSRGPDAGLPGRVAHAVGRGRRGMCHIGFTAPVQHVGTAGRRSTAASPPTGARSASRCGPPVRRPRRPRRARVVRGAPPRCR